MLRAEAWNGRGRYVEAVERLADDDDERLKRWARHHLECGAAWVDVYRVEESGAAQSIGRFRLHKQSTGPGWQLEFEAVWP